ncbi:hypothetical protein IG518_21950, partial [Vibrio cholerae]|nr:hypothetical protein [Vibrio cholerae]
NAFYSKPQQHGLDSLTLSIAFIYTRLSIPIVMNSPAAYLQRQVVWDIRFRHTQADGCYFYVARL